MGGGLVPPSVWPRIPRGGFVAERIALVNRIAAALNAIDPGLGTEWRGCTGPAARALVNYVTGEKIPNSSIDVALHDMALACEAAARRHRRRELVRRIKAFFGFKQEIAGITRHR